ncbi:MAG: MCE family protein [Acidobacteria bacterium]|nr:MCE family protein [Acidobacteriota bacterium]
MSRLARLGLFIFGALVILSAAIFLIGERQFLFSRTYRLLAPFDNVAGLNNGADVRLGGVRVGTVDHIRMPQHPEEKVMVVIELENSTRQVIKKDSIASIETEGLLGNKYVSVSFGSAQAAPVQDGDTIQGRPPVDLSELVKKANAIMDTADAALKNVDAATANLNSITAKVDRGEGTIGALINDRQVYNQINATTADVRETVAKAKHGVTALDENMQALKRNWFFRGFFKDRGYWDSTELTKYEIDKLPNRPVLKKFVYNAKDVFEKPDSANLKNEKSLNQAGKFIEQTPMGLAVVAAYSDLTGEKDKNLMLTQARAMVVRKYLAEKFRIDDTRVKTKGMGEVAPTDGGQASRVEIIVYR